MEPTKKNVHSAEIQIEKGDIRIDLLDPLREVVKPVRVDYPLRDSSMALEKDIGSKALAFCQATLTNLRGVKAVTVSPYQLNVLVAPLHDANKIFNAVREFASDCLDLVEVFDLRAWRKALSKRPEKPFEPQKAMIKVKPVLLLIPRTSMLGKRISGYCLVVVDYEVLRGSKEYVSSRYFDFNFGMSDTYYLSGNEELGEVEAIEAKLFEQKLEDYRQKLAEYEVSEAYIGSY